MKFEIYDNNILIFKNDKWVSTVPLSKPKTIE